MATTLEIDRQRSIEKRIASVYELPPMPDLGRRILQLQHDPDADSARLAKIVQLDPSLAAQVIRHARSSYYGYQGRITGVQDAISRVLGYELALNLALGLAAGRSFRIPDEGPLGLSSFWQHAILSAVLVQRLGATMAADRRPPLGLSYLSGLLHDFGLLLLGHLFPPEFRLLNRFAAADPHRTLPELECQLLGMGGARELLAMGHARIGAWLMHAWAMPEPIAIALVEHHNPDYRGDHQALVHLVQLSDFLQQSEMELKMPRDLPAASLNILGLPPEKVMGVAADVFSARDELAALSSLAVQVS